MAKRSCRRGWPDVLVICRKPSGYAFLKYRKAFYNFIIEFDLPVGAARVGSGGWFDRCRVVPPLSATTRLVALNAARAVEEAQGQVHWLRPAYQHPGSATPGQQAAIETPDDASPELAPTGPSKPQKISPRGFFNPPPALKNTEPCPTSGLGRIFLSGCGIKRSGPGLKRSRNGAKNKLGGIFKYRSGKKPDLQGDLLIPPRQQVEAHRDLQGPKSKKGRGEPPFA